MTPPLIGVTTFHSVSPTKNYQYISVTEAYVHALTGAGAIPVPIPLQLPEEHLDELVGRLDGILFTGGGDLAPARYSGADHPLLENVDPERDRVELYLAERVFDSQLPFLGICRGLQTINIARGGTLYLDIDDEVPGSLKHDLFDKAPRTFLAHPVRIGEASILSGIVGQPIFKVNSGHHQAVKALGSGLSASALAPDGIVEAVELSTHPFGLAVQWHPEWLTHIPSQLAIFKAFVRAALSNSLR